MQQSKLTKPVCLADLTCRPKILKTITGECRPTVYMVETSLWVKAIFSGKRYSFNHIPSLMFQDAHVKSVKHTGLVCLNTGGISL